LSGNVSDDVQTTWPEGPTFNNY